ncbi:GNAT family N-acetyltransferase [Pseudescherichia vulneris]|uniref:GNAT family N-acetyltransferase n=1 Tax=Pseudescherichia vulneris TaxID=566 RepID=UPI003AFAD8BF
MGFSLLRRYPANQERYDIDQFFVLRRFKGMGIGKAAFRQAVLARPKQWQTRVLLENISAMHFWRSAMAAVVRRSVSGTNSA